MPFRKIFLFVPLIICSAPSLADSIFNHQIVKTADPYIDDLRWKVGIETGSSRVTEDTDEYVNPNATPIQTKKSIGTKGFLLGYRFYKNLWLHTGARKNSEENFPSCNIYDETECVTFTRNSRQVSMDINYSFYFRPFDAFNSEIGLGIGRIVNTTESSLGDTRTSGMHYSIYAAGFFYQKWQLSMRAESSTTESETGKPMDMSTTTLGLNYLF